jgi:hypothetical protein
MHDTEPTCLHFTTGKEKQGTRDSTLKHSETLHSHWAAGLSRQTDRQQDRETGRSTAWRGCKRRGLELEMEDLRYLCQVGQPVCCTFVRS